MPCGYIQGTIEDKSSSTAIENAEVLLEDQDGSQLLRARSDLSGKFYLFGLPTGSYALRVQKDEYPEYTIQSVRVQNGCMSFVEVEMEKDRSPQGTSVMIAWEGRPSALWLEGQETHLDLLRMGDLPTARNIWALIQNQNLSSVPNNMDEGGLQTGIIQLVGTHGGTWTQNSYRLDGLNVTNPYEPGKPLTYPDLEGLQGFNVSGAYNPAAISASGADFQMTSRHGGGKIHGQVEVSYLGNPLQSSNLDNRLREFGFDTTPHFGRFPAGGFSIGGPLPRSQRWFFFGAVGIQHMSRIVPDFAAQPTTDVYSGLLRMDGNLRPRDQISMLVSGQIVQNSNLGARPGIEPASTLHGNDRFEQIQGHWMHRRNERSLWGLSLGFSHASPTDTLQEGITSPNYARLFTGEMTGAAPVESDSALTRFSLSGQSQMLRGAPKGWLHQLAFGFDMEESLATEEQRVFQGLNLFLYPEDLPSEVAEFNSPSHAKQRLRELSFFIEDRLGIADRLFIRLGANLDSSNASLPSQISGASPYAPAREFVGADSVVSWTTVSPRLGLTVPVKKRWGAMRFSAGYARYYHVLPAAYANYANPTALGGAVFRWIDGNHDGVFQPGEEGALLRVFGGPYSSVDPHLKRPFTDEWGLSIQHDLGRSMQVDVNLLERDSKHLVHTVNVGVPSSDYTPVQVADLGNDNLPGTGDEQTLTVLNQNLGTLGRDRYLLTNPPGLNARYRGLEAALHGRLAGQGFFSVSFAAYKSEGDGNPGNSELENDAGVIGDLFNDPNTLINSRGRLFFDRAYVGKAAAYYRFPWGFHLGSVISYFDGMPFGRKLIIPDFNQGPFFIMATPRGEPGGFRTQYALNFDQRISREFALRNARMTAMVDIFNLLNSNNSLREFDISGPLFSQRRPQDIQNPRAFRVGIRFSF